MPPVVAAITTAVASFLTAGFTQSVFTTLLNFAGRALLTVGLNAAASALTGKPKPASVTNPGLPLTLTANPNAPRSVIYGETAVAGQVILSRLTSDNKYLHIISAIGDGGPYDSIQSIKLAGETVTLDGSGNITSPAKWAGKGRIEIKLGSTSQTAFSNAVSEIADWTSNHVGKGISLAYMRFEYDPEAWNTGRPEPLFVARGRASIYDPRLDSSPGNDPTNASYQAWTQNPALWVLDFIRGVTLNGQRIMGLGIPDALIDWDSFADAADVCDESVAVKAGGTISRYTGGGGQITSDDDPIGVIEAMLSSFAGVITTRSGKIACYAGEAQTAAVTLDDDDWAGPVKITAGAAIRETANAVNPQYREPDLGYEWTSAPPYRNSTWETEDDGEELWTELQLPFVDDHRVAQRLAKIFAGDKREPHYLEAKCKIKALQILEGQTFTLDSDSYGSAVNGKYRLVKRTVNADGTVDIQARSETDAKYSWTAASEERDAPSGSISTVPDPTTPTPTGWTASVSQYNGSQGATYAAINLAVSGTIPPTVGQVEIQVKRQTGESLGLDFLGGQYGSAASGASGDNDYVPIATLTRQQAADGYRINGLEWARGYSIRIRYVSYFGVTGSWLTIETSVTTAGGAVSAPTGWTGSSSTLTSAEGYARPVLAVTAPTAGIPEEASVVSIDYRKPTDSAYSGQVVLSRSDASRGYNLPAEPGTDYIVRVRYGADAATWGPEQVLAISASATSAISLSGFAVAANATTDGTYTQPGFKASWTALAGDNLRRANVITIQYRRDGDSEVSTLAVEPDATSVNVWGVLPGVTYNVRARVEEVYQSGDWTSWEDVTVGSTFTSSGFNGQGALATQDSVDWTSDVSNRPTELTDGRVSTALDAFGILQTNVPNASQIPTLTASKISDLGALGVLDQIGNAQVDGTNPIDYSKISFPRQENATDDSPIATSFGASYTELLRISFDEFGENHALNFAGSAFRFRTSSTGAADAECTITWKLIASDTSGSDGGNAQTLAEGFLSVVETAPSSGVFHVTDDGTTGGTPLPGGPLTTWSNIRGFANIAAAQGAQIIVESQLFSWPLSTVYLSLWMKADSGATGYLNTGAGQCLLVGSGIGDLQNP